MFDTINKIIVKTKLYRILLTIGTFILAMRRFMVAFPDSLQYIRMVENILYIGGICSRQTHSPFYYRILIPWLASPLAIFTGAEAAIGVISIISTIIWAHIFYSICAEFSKNDLVTFVVTCAAVISPAVTLYGGTALVDAPAMATMAGIVLIANKEELLKKDWLIVMLLFCIGLFIKESVVFAGLYFLYTQRSKKAVLLLLPGGIAYIIFRVFVFGTVAQPLIPKAFPHYGLNITFWLLNPLIIMSLFLVVAWVRFDNLTWDAFCLLIFGLLAFLPYYYMGAYLAYFDMRFIWPLMFAFAPAATVGLNSAWEAFHKRLHFWWYSHHKFWRWPH